MKKRVISILLVLGFICLTLPHSAAADPYFAMQSQFLNAVAGGRDEDIIPAAEQIVEYYDGVENEVALSRQYAPALSLVQAYERQGQYVKTKKAYERLNRCCQWLSVHASASADRLAFAEAGKAIARKQRYFEDVQVYLLTSNTATVPNYGALHEPLGGTYNGMCDTYTDGEQSSLLLYLQYANESFAAYSYQMPKTQKTCYLEIAWNLPNENLADLDAINSGSTDAYMLTQLREMESLAKEKTNYRILLRFAAEVNCWPALNSIGLDTAKLNAFADSYIKAFRRVAGYARTYAPHVAMVYSPVDYGSWATTPADFYPGDGYVDWIGMSTYSNRSAQAQNTVASNNDMLWGYGLYSNPIVRVGEIVALAEEHQKPVMISECGSCYECGDGVQTQDYSAANAQYFFTYVNMVYPQVKVINYFNTNYGNYHYRISPSPYPVVDNSVSQKVWNAYDQAVRSNAPIVSTLNGDGQLFSYVDVPDFEEKTDTLQFSVYVGYPTTSTKTVQYSLNDGAYAGTTQMPYLLNIAVKDLKVGTNVLSVRITCSNTIVEQNYLLYLDEDGTVCGEMNKKTDIAVNGWYRDAVGYCMYHALMRGTSPDSFAPNNPMTRGMMVTVLWRMSGSPLEGINHFEDVVLGSWYESAVAWAEKNNIVTGVGNHCFAPDENITREQAATMMARYAAFYGMNDLTGDDDLLLGFRDGQSTSNWAKASVCWCIHSGLISGKGDAVLDPGGNATRAELCKILWKFSMLLK